MTNKPMEETNPVLNSPYAEPRWHYATDISGNLNYEDIRPERRVFDPEIGGYSMPVQKTKQGSLLEVNDFQAEYGTHLINLLRKEVGIWRNANYPDTTGVTRDLLHFWFLNPERHPTRRLFFAQREAIETAIWLNEVAQRSNAGNHILNKINAANNAAENGSLNRICFKMATGTGKTVVMAALILYQYINRQQYRQDTRFCDYFLLVAPGITIKDRLGVLFVDNSTNNKNDAKDYYRERDLVPQKFEKLLEGLNARLVITNYHAFEPKTLQGNKRSVFDGKLGPDGKKQEAKEEMAQVLRRLMPGFKPGGRLLVLNDEAHHCYLPREKGKNTEESNTEDENERAAVWYTGISEVAKRWQVRAVYDLSATPYYLSGSGYPAYTLFPWIVSEFGLVDAIESGLVKIPVRTVMSSAFMGERDNMEVRDALDCREQEITYGIARQLVNLYFRDPENGVQWHLFPQLQRICAQWYREKVVVVGDRDPQSEYKKLVACMDTKAWCDHIYEAIRIGRRQRGEERILPVFNHYNPFGSTKYVHGLTTKPCYETHKSHVNYVVADAASTREDANFWEHIAAKTLEELPEVQSYVKNAYCDFQIPYIAEGKERHYKPDFLVRCPLPNGETLMLILEITGANKQFKAEKKFYTETYWIPAVMAVRESYPQLRGEVGGFGGEWGGKGVKRADFKFTQIT